MKTNMKTVDEIRAEFQMTLILELHAEKQAAAEQAPIYASRWALLTDLAAQCFGDDQMRVMVEIAEQNK